MVVSVAQIQFFFLALTRILAMVIHVPVLGGRTIPSRVIVGLGFLLTITLIPWQHYSTTAETLGVIPFGIAIARETLLGTLAGYAATLTFGTVQIAGEAMGFGSGFESGRVFNPTLNESGSAFNQLFVITSMMIFLCIDGHHSFIMAMGKTFEIIPINGNFPFTSVNTLISMTAQLITAGIHLALPIIAAIFITDLTFGLLARVAPQVQVYFLGLPLKIVVSLVALGLTFSIAAPYISNLFTDLGVRVIRMLGGS